MGSDLQHIGRYTIHGEIASGGMATVYLARLNGPAGFGRMVAIKRLHPQYAKDPEFVTMFLDEARIAARIHHPNVVPTLDVLVAEGELAIVLEYVDGAALHHVARHLRKSGTPIPVDIACAITCDVLRGLHAAHETTDDEGRILGLVHRDVSPQNVLLTREGLARITDFGVAFAMGRLQVTVGSKFKGKIGYSAPEQLSGGNVTRLTDVYAVGIVLWELLAGRRLFQGADDIETFTNALRASVEAPSKLVEGIPTAVDDIVLRALAREPSERYPTATSMAAALSGAVRLASQEAIADWLRPLLESVVHRPVTAASAGGKSGSESSLHDLLAQISGLEPSRPTDRPEAAKDPHRPSSIPVESEGGRTTTPPTTTQETHATRGRRAALIAAPLVAVVAVASTASLIRGRSGSREDTRASAITAVAAAGTTSSAVPVTDTAEAPSAFRPPPTTSASASPPPEPPTATAARTRPATAAPASHAPSRSSPAGATPRASAPAPSSGRSDSIIDVVGTRR